MRRLLAAFSLVGALIAGGLFLLFSGSGDLSDEDLAPVRRLGDVEAALLWRETAVSHADTYRDMEASEMRGYTRLHDSAYGPWEHLINWDAVEDDRVLDPSEPEILVYRVEDGAFLLQAFAFILPSRYTLANTPDIAQGSGAWHTHPAICLMGDPFVDPANGRLIASLAPAGGSCPKGVNFPDVLMVHAWVEPNACGPFAPSLGEVDRIDDIFAALSGVDASGKTPACDPALARRVWGL